MNPPFTRSVSGNLLFGSLPAADRRKLQSELSRRLRSRQASATAGLGAAFVAAAAPAASPARDAWRWCCPPPYAPAPRGGRRAP